MNDELKAKVQTQDTQVETTIETTEQKVDINVDDEQEQIDIDIETQQDTIDSTIDTDTQKIDTELGGVFIGISKVNDVTVNGKSVVENKVAKVIVPTTVQELKDSNDYAKKNEIPTATSQLINNSGYITRNDLPKQPTKVSELENDTGYITEQHHDNTKQDTLESGVNIKTINNKSILGHGNMEIKGAERTSELENDSGFITAKDIPTIPTKTSDLKNDSGFIDRQVDNLANYTVNALLSPVATSGSYYDLKDRPTIPERTSQIVNDSGYITKEQVPEVELPTKLSQLENDTHYITIQDIPQVDVPTRLSQLINDKGYITLNDIPPIPDDIATKQYVNNQDNQIKEWVENKGYSTFSGDYNDLENKPNIPTKTSDLINDSQFVKANEIPPFPTKVSDLENDSGYITNENANITENQVQNLVGDLQNIRETAAGKTKTYIVSNNQNPLLDSQESTVNVERLILPDGSLVTPAMLNLGDTIYIKELNVPDRWVSETQSPTPKLPDEYQEIEFLQGDGYSFIDTGVNTNQNTGIDLKFEITSDNNQAVIGGRNNTTSNTLTFFYLTNGKYVRLDFSGQHNFTTPITVGSVHNLKIENNGSKFDAILDNEMWVSNIPTSVPTVNNYIFAVNERGIANQKSTAKVYSYKIYDRDVLIHDFVPCFRIFDNKSGMYDMATGTFIEESGTGHLIRGNPVSYGANIKLERLETQKVDLNNYVDTYSTQEINGVKQFNNRPQAKIDETTYDYVATMSDIPDIPQDYVKLTTDQTIDGQKDFNTTPRVFHKGSGAESHGLPDNVDELEYIEFNSHLESVATTNTNYMYINTEIVPDDTTEFEILYDYQSYGPGVASGQGVALGGRISSSSYVMTVSGFNTKPTGYFGFGNNARYEAYLIKGINKITFKNHIYNIENETYNKMYNVPSTTYPSNMQPLYLGALNNAGSPAENLKGKIFYCKIWKGGQLVREFYPAMTGSTVGFYDKISGRLFTRLGNGSGNLVGGPQVNDRYYNVLTDASFSKASITGNYNDLYNKPIIPVQHIININATTSSGTYKCQCTINAPSTTTFTTTGSIAAYLYAKQPNMRVIATGTYTTNGTVYQVESFEAISNSQIRIEMYKVYDGTSMTIDTGAVNVVDIKI